MAVKDCVAENKRQVPLMKVVKAAIVDVYGDINRLQQQYAFWASRGLAKLQRETLKVGKTKILLTVNHNTKTATLPLDFGEEIFVGYINTYGEKVPLKLNPKLADGCNIQEIPYEDTCTSCGQDKTICEDLAVTEDVTLVVINDSTYENKVIKKLYPNGDYYLETTKWVLDLNDDTVSANVTKEFITNFGLKPCGCLETTVDNIAKIQTYSYDCYACNYTSCCNDTSDYGYAIFEESGLIQFDYKFPYDKVYLEYLGFMPKKNGQYMVPEVAFETLVEYTKWKSIKDKKGVERWRIKDTFDDYIRERKNMMKVLTRVSLFDIIAAIRSTPKFNLDWQDSWYSCFSSNAFTNANSLLTGTSGGSSTGGDGDTTIINNYPTTIINNASYQLAVKTGDGPGHPVDDTSTYQNSVLVSATDIEFIIVAKQIFSKINGDFTFNSITGTIDISPNKFFTGDSLIIAYNKTT